MKNNEIISIQELTEITGKSKAYFYKEFNQKFNKYSTLLNGKKCFYRSILNEFNSTDIQLNSQLKFNQISTNENTEKIKAELTQKEQTIKDIENELKLLQANFKAKDDILKITTDNLNFAMQEINDLKTELSIEKNTNRKMLSILIQQKQEQILIEDKKSIFKRFIGIFKK